MSTGAWALVAVMLITAATLLFLLVSVVKSIRAARTPGRSLWREFGLGLGLMVLFFGSWIAQGIAEWQVYTDEQAEHGAEATIGDFSSQFAQSTLENWQSEFLQLFSFVVLAALYIHKGSGESKDGEEQIQAALRRLETRLGTLPASAPTEPGREWELPATPLERQDEVES